MSTPTFRPTIPRTRNVWLAMILLLSVSLPGRSAEETNSVSPPAEAPASDMVNSYVQLQAQLHATQLALEQNRKELEALTAKNSEALASRLEQIELALAARRARELESPNNSNRLLLAVASTVGGMGFIALLLTGYLQWRTVNRLTGLSTVLADATRLALPPAAGLPTGDVSSARLLGALNRLEQRMLELENPTQPDRGPQSSAAIEAAATADATEPVGVSNDSNHIAILLAKGQSLLSLGQPAAAMDCFDEVLAQHPDHPEALVKKGLGFEHQQKPEEALRCYDRAIAGDSNFTQAHLQKAALCNRIGHYDQAVASYEQALHVRERRQKS